MTATSATVVGTGHIFIELAMQDAWHTLRTKSQFFLIFDVDFLVVDGRAALSPMSNWGCGRGGEAKRGDSYVHVWQ